jgi:flagellar biosynthesis protein FliR
MENGLYPLLLGLLQQMWWPFVRVMALLAFAPVLADGMVPMRVRVLLALTLALVLMPATGPAVQVALFSGGGLALTLEQVAIGAVIGLALQLVTASLAVLGYLLSSQTGLAMALLNDPVNGSSSDVLSVLLGLLGILVFFSIDGHLLVVGVLAASFKAWPVGGGLQALTLQTLAYNVGWIFAAAFLLATPVVFSAWLVQLGFGFLARISPSLNLFSLGFSVVTLFGLLMLAFLLRHLPGHYIAMTQRSLDLIAQMMRGNG